MQTVETVDNYLARGGKITVCPPKVAPVPRYTVKAHRTLLETAVRVALSGDVATALRLLGKE